MCELAQVGNLAFEPLGLLDAAVQVSPLLLDTLALLLKFSTLLRPFQRVIGLLNAGLELLKFLLSIVQMPAGVSDLIPVLGKVVQPTLECHDLVPDNDQRARILGSIVRGQAPLQVAQGLVELVEYIRHTDSGSSSRNGLLEHLP